MSAESPELGLDLGATLTKAVVGAKDAPFDGLEMHTFPSADADTLAAFLGMRPGSPIAATGAGARRLIARFPERTIRLVDEFEAWGAGERHLLSRADFVPSTPHLLVSLGTGTSILRVGEDGSISRVGGTGLGGGTLRGLGQLLLNEESHDALTALAGGGDRRRIDLLVSDLYGSGEIALEGDLTASNLGRVMSRDPRDVAHAVTGLIGENIGLLAGALARQERVDGPLDVVYAGATLRENPALHDVLSFATLVGGARARFLPHGEYVGALGALVTPERRPA